MGLLQRISNFLRPRPPETGSPAGNASSPESVALSAGVAKLLPLLDGNGFQYQAGDIAIAHEAFATGVFRRNVLEISLIVRHGSGLGCPNYSVGQGFAGHEDLFSALGHANRAHLVKGDFPAYRARDGGDPFVALEDDLRRIVLPALQASERDFHTAVGRAHARFQNRLRGKAG
jgi:hypothetical protein